MCTKNCCSRCVSPDSLNPYSGPTRQHTSINAYGGHLRPCQFSTHSGPHSQEMAELGPEPTHAGGLRVQALNQHVEFWEINLAMTCETKCKTKKNQRQERQIGGTAVTDKTTDANGLRKKRGLSTVEQFIFI